MRPEDTEMASGVEAETVPLVNTLEALQPDAEGWYELKINEQVRQEIVGALYARSEIEEKHAPNSALRILHEVLPLAEAYLKNAPSAPEHAFLEEARALLLKHRR